ncbi:MAG: TfoX/Sxy family protein [Gemmatimonadales bacterium]|nr:TfoX/Sxy family protein [Gemmatimonadales bacterium]
MAYDEAAAARVRKVLAGEQTKGVSEKPMFGGLSFLLNGNMCCGILKDDLVLRVGPDLHDTALARPHARPMDFTRRPMRGFVYVAPPGFATAALLRSWVKLTLGFVGTLPSKAKGRTKPKRRAG